MRTNELIAALATNAPAIDPTRVEQRFYTKLAGGAGVALAAMLLLIGPRADLADASLLPMFWLKLLFPAGLAAAALVGLWRLSHPGMRVGHVPAAAALLVTLVWMLAGVALLAAPAGERLPLVFGKTWLECLVTIAGLSVPALWLALRATRELAPTRLAVAGMAAGLFAGAAAAFAYALHCVEMQAPFVAVWYVLGMLISTGAGALLGRRLLHW